MKGHWSRHIPSLYNTHARPERFIDKAADNSKDAKT